MYATYKHVEEKYTTRKKKKKKDPLLLIDSPPSLCVMNGASSAYEKGINPLCVRLYTYNHEAYFEKKK